MKVISRIADPKTLLGAKLKNNKQIPEAFLQKFQDNFPAGKALSRRPLLLVRVPINYNVANSCVLSVLSENSNK